VFRWFSQIWVLFTLNIGSLPQRKGSVFSAVFGIAGVVAVLVGVLSIGQGFRRAMTVSAQPDTAMVLRSGADTEMMSGLSREDARVIGDAPGVVRDEVGPLASAELFVIINLPKRSTGTDANVPLRGVEQAAFKVRDNFKLEAGRPFEPGRNEVVVGVAAQAEFAGLDLGADLQVGPNTWTVVGVFSDNGSVAESEIWADAGVLQPAYRRGATFQSVYAKLRGPERFAEFKDALTSDPRLNVKVLRQSDYYEEQSSLMYGLITGLGALIAILMALGAIFGALNTMYNAVASRSREIATLRALGFPSGPVLIAVLMESLALAMIGGVIGAALAYLAFDGYRAATLNFSSFSQVAFAFEATPALMLAGVFLAAFIGLLGGLLPAVRAARLPIAAALREQ